MVLISQPTLVQFAATTLLVLRRLLSVRTGNHFKVTAPSDRELT